MREDALRNGKAALLGREYGLDAFAGTFVGYESGLHVRGETLHERGDRFDPRRGTHHLRGEGLHQYACGLHVLGDADIENDVRSFIREEGFHRRGEGSHKPRDALIVHEEGHHRHACGFLLFEERFHRNACDLPRSGEDDIANDERSLLRKRSFHRHA